MGRRRIQKKEAALSDQSEKDNASLIESDSGVEVVKEGGNQEKSEEESDIEEEEKEEGEIEMATQARRRQEEENQPRK